MTTQHGTGHGSGDTFVAGTSLGSVPGTGATLSVPGSTVAQNPEPSATGTGTGPGTALAVPGSAEVSAASTTTVETTETGNPGTRTDRSGFRPGATLTDEQLAAMSDAEFATFEANIRDGKFDAKAPADKGPEPRSVRLIATIGLTALSAIVGVMASVGQYAFGKANGAVDLIKIKDFDLTPWLTPAIFDLAMIVFLNSGMRAAYRDRSPWPWWGVAGGIGALSVVTNTQHAGALIFASASLVLLAAWFMRMRDQYIELEIARKRRAGRKSQILLSKLTLVAPRISIRAWIIDTRYSEIRDPITGEERPLKHAEAIYLARLWLDIRADMAAKHLTKRGWWLLRRDVPDHALAKRTAWDAIDDQLGVLRIKRTGIKVATVEYATPEAPAPQRPPVVPNRKPDQRRDQADPPAGGGTPPRTPGEMSPADMPEAEWFVTEARRIAKAQAELRNWRQMALTGRLSVEIVRTAGGAGNKQAATRVRKCLIKLAFDSLATTV